MTSVVGTVPWRIIATRAWNLALSRCQEQKDVAKLDKHLLLRLKPLVVVERRRPKWKPAPWVPGQMGKLNG